MSSNVFFLSKFVEKFEYNLFLNANLSVMAASVSPLDAGVQPNFYWLMCIMWYIGFEQTSLATSGIFYLPVASRPAVEYIRLC